MVSDFLIKLIAKSENTTIKLAITHDSNIIKLITIDKYVTLKEISDT